jgi:hypothetical protein
MDDDAVFEKKIQKAGQKHEAIVLRNNVYGNWAEFSDKAKMYPKCYRMNVLVSEVMPQAQIQKSSPVSIS